MFLRVAIGGVLIGSMLCRFGSPKMYSRLIEPPAELINEQKIEILMRAERTDANQQDIIDDLRKVGADVYVIKRPVDILVGYRNRCWVFEIKDPKQTKQNRQLTKFQETFFRNWRGQVDKIETSEQAIKIITEQK